MVARNTIGRAVWLWVAVCLLLVSGAHASLVGIDLGSEVIKVAAVQAGVPFHMVQDEQTKQLIPALIAFDPSNGEQFFGNNAKSLLARKPDTVYTYVRDLLAQPVNSPFVAHLKTRGFPYKFVATNRSDASVVPGGAEAGLMAGIEHADPKSASWLESSASAQRYVFTAEELVAMLMQYIRGLAVQDILKESPQDKTPEALDCVIAVPSWFTQAERESLRRASELGGWRVLEMVSDNEAAATQLAIGYDFEQTLRKAWNAQPVCAGHVTSEECTGNVAQRVAAVGTVSDVCVPASAQEHMDQDFNEAVYALFNMGGTSTQVDVIKLSSYWAKGTPPSAEAVFATETNAKSGKKNIERNKLLKHSRGQVSVLARAYDVGLGTASFETVLQEMLFEGIREAAQAKADKGKLSETLLESLDDALDNDNRVRAKVRKAAAAKKRVLSANQDCHVFFSSLWNDMDFEVHVTREQLYERSQGLFQRVQNVVKEAVVRASMGGAGYTGSGHKKAVNQNPPVPPCKIRNIIMLGGGARIPGVQKAVSEFFNGDSKRLGFGLDGDFSAAMGSVFVAANKSTKFKVRAVGLAQQNTHAVHVKILGTDVNDGDTGDSGVAVFTKQATLFPTGHAVDKRKTVGFNHGTDFFTFLTYANHIGSTGRVGCAREGTSYGVMEFCDDFSSSGSGDKHNNAASFNSGYLDGLFVSGVTELTHPPADLATMPVPSDKKARSLYEMQLLLSQGKWALIQQRLTAQGESQLDSEAEGALLLPELPESAADENVPQTPKISLSFHLSQSGVVSVAKVEAQMAEMKAVIRTDYVEETYEVEVPQTTTTTNSTANDTSVDGGEEVVDGSEDVAPTKTETRTRQVPVESYVYKEGVRKVTLKALRLRSIAPEYGQDDGPIHTRLPFAMSDVQRDRVGESFDKIPAGVQVELLVKIAEYLGVEGSDGFPRSPQVLSRHKEAMAKSVLRLLAVHQYWRSEITKAKNDLESYVYATKDQLYQDEVEEVTTDDEREALFDMCREVEDWVYDVPDEVSDAIDEDDPVPEDEDVQEGTPGNIKRLAYRGRRVVNMVYAKLNELKSLTRPFQQRLYEREHLPETLESAADLLNVSSHMLGLIREERPWVPSDKLTAAEESAASLELWLAEESARQSALAPTDDPVLTTEMVTSRMRELQQAVSTLIKMKAPKPAKPAKNETGADSEQPQTSSPDEGGVENGSNVEGADVGGSDSDAGVNGSDAGVNGSGDDAGKTKDEL